MKLYEASNGRGDCIIYVNKKEAKTFVKAFELAYNSNKRFKSIKSILDKFNKQLACY